MTTTLAQLHELQRIATSALRRYLIDGRTEDLRQVAENFVDARAYFFTKDGRPDWLGRSNVYRRWVRETTTAANVPASELATVQAAIRYHAGNILRDKLSPEEVAELGLKQESPRERSTAKRAAQSEILSIFGAGGTELTVPSEILHVVDMIEGALSRLSSETLAVMGADDRRHARKALRGIAERADDLAVAAGARRL